ncbi:MAG: Ppx/GppA phosphatase family protein [Pseudomonadota bacterium]
MTVDKMRDDRKPTPRSGSRKRRKPPLYAAVDLGTNNCRLLIAARRGDTFTVVDSHSQIARLGEGLEATGRLSDAAIERAMDALTKIGKKVRAKKVGHVRCIATEACRRAENGAAFIQRVRDETGLTFKVIGPEEEARLALVGCHNLIERGKDRVLVIDIGGGSTELSFVDAQRAQAQGLKGMLEKPPILGWRSLPIGVVTLTEAFAHMPEDKAYPQMLAHVTGLIEKWKRTPEIRQVFEEDRAHIIGTSGTVTCLTGVAKGLTKYRRADVDGTWISRQKMMQTVEQLRAAGAAKMHVFPTIGTDRSGLMLAGCAIVEATWSLAPSGRMRVADRGLREGLLLTMMHGPKRRGKKRRRRSTPKPQAATESAAA